MNLWEVTGFFWGWGGGGGAGGGGVYASTPKRASRKPECLPNHSGRKRRSAPALPKTVRTGSGGLLLPVIGLYLYP